jgi:hypothetical protein
MTSDRVYRPAMSPEVAFVELHKGKGTQFDPAIVELFENAYWAERRADVSTLPTPPAAPASAPAGLVRRLAPQLFVRRPQVG